jgi:hypothetical protein
MTRRRLTRTAVSLALAAVGAVTLSLAAAVPAHAAPPEVLVSTDGFTFAPTLSHDLFDLDLLVPGESLEASLWVRNPGTSAGLMRIMVDSLVVDSDAFRTGVTLTATEGGNSTSAPLGDLDACAVVVAPLTVPAGGDVRIDLEVRMSETLTGLEGQAGDATLGLRVAMRDAVAGPFPPGDACVASAADPAPAGDGLAFTGARLIVPTLIVAFVLLVGGILFLFIRRRRSDEETEES